MGQIRQLRIADHFGPYFALSLPSKGGIPVISLFLPVASSGQHPHAFISIR
jgi:hypothetical protein